MSAIAGINLDQMAYDHAFWQGVKATRQLVDFNKLLEAKTEEELAYNVVRTYYQAKIMSQQRDILHLLDQSLKAEGVQIFIGQESGYTILDDCSVVTAPYSLDQEVVGVLGVIGPTRMAYERVIPIVD